MSTKVGNLVYIPSDTDLLQFDKSSPSKIFLTQSPTNLIVLKEEENKLGVLFEGEVWYVDKKKVYSV
mgnify:CR=1 FL=1|tara:strand:+ start:305 stop:505 length:201 start_codon:yes stop_codon:yes gene_type:complete